MSARIWKRRRWARIWRKTADRITALYDGTRESLTACRRLARTTFRRYHPKG